MLAWIWQWVGLPIIIMCVVFYPPWLVSKIPFLSAIINSWVIIFIFINIDAVELPYLGNPVILLVIILVFALLDCIIELFYTIIELFYKTKYNLDKFLVSDFKASKDQDLSISKLLSCITISTIVTLICYYGVPNDNRIDSVLSHYGVILFSFVAPRALFVIAEINFIKEIFKVRPKAEKVIKNNFFKIPENDDSSLIRYLKFQKKIGLFISNEETIKREKSISLIKLEKMYPKGFIAKLVEKFAGDKEMLKIREECEKELGSIETKIAYVTKSNYENYIKVVDSILRESGSLSPRTLIEKKFPEVSDNWLAFGADFFVIQALAPAINFGRIMDEDKSDDPLVNHAYRHTESSVAVTVINANEDPRLALDD